MNEQYKEALKKTKSIGKSESGIQVTFSSDTTLIFSHKKGIEFLAALEGAQQFKSYWSEAPKFGGLNNDSVTIQAISENELDDIKVAVLLNIPLHEAKGMK